MRPSSSQTPVGLGDTKETPFCNVTEDVSITDPRKGLHFYPCLSVFPKKDNSLTYCQDSYHTRVIFEEVQQLLLVMFLLTGEFSIDCHKDISHFVKIDFISINSCVFPNRCVLIKRACSLALTESLRLEGFSINQLQCFTESAQRTPSWRSRWRSCLPGCQCAMIGGTPPWERWSANSWVI